MEAMKMKDIIVVCKESRRKMIDDRLNFSGNALQFNTISLSIGFGT